ncbi:MAG: cohesin domain-containing protein [Patescibacteria group bacterium]|jgi:hypothetical protein|nr:cohesin domain-containing protein [Patescibacteria group bacterium]
MSKIFFKLKLFFAVLLLLLLGLSNSKPVQAASASLYLTPSSGTHVINSTFTVTVKVNSDGVSINAAEGTVVYDTDSLDVVSISKAGSIFNLWTAEPTDTGTSINFGGGIPRPGYTGSGGTLFSVTFKGVKAENAQVRFSSGAVLANDGKGTNILASMGSGSYTISPKVIAPANPPVDNKPVETRPAVVERVKPEIISVTHPDQEKWYKNKDAQFEWDIPSEVSGVSYLFNDSPDSNPGNTSDGLIKTKEFTDLEDGIFYLHVKFKDGDGWGTIAHYKIQVDNSPPLPFEIEVKKEEGEDWPLLSFETKDELSGVVSYQITIDNLTENAFEASPEDPTLRVSGLGVGEHTALVKVIDAAGNETYSEQKFYINAIDTPVIVNYPSEMTSSDRLYVSGTALPNVEIELTIQKEGTLLTKSTRSDQDGNWFIINEDKLSNGSYVAWAKAINANGLSSENSVKIGFLVSPPIFTRIGDFVVNYFTVFVSLLFLILLIIILFILLARLTKKKLKKEATEIEVVLRENIKELRKEIENDFTEIKKGKSSVAQKKLLDETQAALKSKIDTMEKKTMKEIRDIEDLVE